MERGSGITGKIDRALDIIRVSIFSFSFIALGAYGIYAYSRGVYRLFVHGRKWYASEALGLLALFAGMFCVGCFMARYYYKEFRGGKETIPDENAFGREDAGPRSKRRENIATIGLALVAVSAGVALIIYSGHEYMLFHPGEPPRVSIAELLQKSRAGLIEVRGRFGYAEVWRGTITSPEESGKERVVFYYPLTDMNTKQHVYAATTMEPGAMMERYGDIENAVRGYWYDFTQEDHKHASMEMNDYLDLQKKRLESAGLFDEAMKEKWTAQRLKMARLPPIRATYGMPFSGILNIDAPGISPLLLLFAGFLFGIPFIVMGISLLKPFIGKKTRRENPNQKT